MTKRRALVIESSFLLTVHNVFNLSDELVLCIYDRLNRPLSTLRISHPEQDTPCYWKTDLGDPESTISTVFDLTPSTFSHGNLLSVAFSVIKEVENMAKACYAVSWLAIHRKYKS